MEKELAPIITFVYARPEHTKNMVESLAKNELAKESEIWIFSDNAKNEKAMPKVKQVREYIHSIGNMDYFKNIHIIEQEKNIGLANSVISGVSDVISQYGKAIVVEDDLTVSSTFLTYMNEALEFYKDDESIWSISGYNPPIEIPEKYKEDVYLSYRGCSWGWATWKDRWNTVDWKVSDYNEFKRNYKKRKTFNRGGNDLSQMLDTQMNGLCDSWAIRWCYSQSKQNKYTIYPVNSLVQNNGLDGSGTHSGNAIQFQAEIKKDKNICFSQALQKNQRILKNFKKMYSNGGKNLFLEMLMILGMNDVIVKYRKRKKAKNHG